MYTMNSIITQHTAQDHVATLLKNLVTQLNVPVSFSAIDETVQQHPLFPVIYDLNDVLNRWGIKTKGVKTTYPNLCQLTNPLIVRTGPQRNHFLLVTQVDAKTVTCIDTQKGVVKLNHYLFEQDWDGVAELIECQPDCGEKTYKQSILIEKKAKRQRWNHRIVAVIITFGLFMSGFLTGITLLHWSLLYFMTAAGALLVRSLLQTESNKKKASLVSQLEKMRVYKLPQVSRTLFMTSPTLHVPRTKHPISEGNLNANLQLTLFLSPTDTKSGTLFLLLRELVSTYTNIRLIIKFLPDNVLAKQVTMTLMTYLSGHTPEKTCQLLESWFLDKHKNLKTFIVKHNIQQGDPNIVQAMITEQERLLQEMKGAYPSLLLINGKKVPVFFNEEDLRYLIVHDPSRLYPSVVTEKEKFWKDKKPVYTS